MSAAAGPVQRPPAEVRFADERARLGAADTGERLTYSQAVYGVNKAGL